MASVSVILIEVSACAVKADTVVVSSIAPVVLIASRFSVVTVPPIISPPAVIVTASGACTSPKVIASVSVMLIVVPACAVKADTVVVSSIAPLVLIVSRFFVVTVPPVIPPPAMIVTASGACTSPKVIASVSVMLIVVPACAVKADTVVVSSIAPLAFTTKVSAITDPPVMLPLLVFKITAPKSPAFISVAEISPLFKFTVVKLVCTLSIMKLSFVSRSN